MVQRRFVFAVLAFGLAACGGASSPPDGWEEDLAAQTDGRGSDSRTSPQDPACEDARERARACAARVEQACAPIEQRLDACRARAQGTGATADRRTCLSIAGELRDCRAACADLRADAEAACAAPDACEEARDALRTCMADSGCRRGASEMRACMERAREVCRADRTAPRPVQPPAWCADPEAHCLRLARRNSDCFATCAPLIDDVRAACGRRDPPDRVRERRDRTRDDGDAGRDRGDRGGGVPPRGGGAR